MKAHRISIDPGVSGAIVIAQGDAVIEWLHMPTMKIGTKNRVNPAALAAALRPFVEDGEAFVEEVAAMPGQGVSSMFSFGHSAGVVAGVLAALGIPTTYVRPEVWKRRAGLTGKDKDAARGRAIQLWPNWRDLDAKGKGQALADAALIGRFGVAE